MLVRALPVSACLAVSPLLASAQDLSGTWVGGTNVTGSWRFAEARLHRAGDAYRGTFDVPGEQAAGLILRDLTVESGAVRFSVSTPIGAFGFTGTLTDDVMDGTVTGGPADARLHLFRTVEPPASRADGAVGTYQSGRRQLLLSYRAAGQLTAFVLERSGQSEAVPRSFYALPVGPDRYVTTGSAVAAMRRDETLTLERDAQGAVTGLRWAPPTGRATTWRKVPDLRQESVRFRGPAGTIAGTLMFPSGAAPYTAALLVSGSGPTSRGTTFLRAREFARVGVAALTVDKRGVGETDGDYFSSSITELADDAAAALDYLSTRADVRGEQVGLSGHSQGAWVAPLAAARARRPPAWMIVTSGGPTPPAEQEAWRAATQVRQAGHDSAAVRAAVAFMQRKWRYGFTGEDWAGYAAAAGGVMRQPWATIVSPTLVQDAFAWAFIRGARDFDPMESASALRTPVLIVFGDQDNEQPVDLTRANWIEAFRRSGHTDHEIVTVPGAGHSLWLGQGSPTPLRTQPTDVIRRWLEPRIGPR